MKFLTFTLAIILCQNYNVNCSFLEYMTSKIGDLATNVFSTVVKLGNQVNKMFGVPARHPRYYVYQVPPGAESKRTFADYVEGPTVDNESEISEYAILKSEPTALMSTAQLALFHGRKIESHVVTTLDGYVITIHRISPTTNFVHKYATNRTVILHHGLLGSSSDWILLGPVQSLPYLLSDAGYDVWFANARGNYYSRGHIRMKVDSAEFWRFSFQEIGQFDLAAMIDYIRNIKNFTGINQKIDYIGHSMGATALLVLLSTSPCYNQYLRIGVLLAPLAFMSNVGGPLKAVTTMAHNPPEHLLRLIGGREFVPSRRMPKWIASKYCIGRLLFCSNPLYFIAGGISSTTSWNTSFVARLLYHIPAGGSTYTILHYAQLVKNLKFHKFNDVSGEFNLRQITLPIALVSSDDDQLATVPDVLKLYFSIANPIDHSIIRGKNFGHTEFVWGPRANELVFSKVIEYLNNGLSFFSIQGNEI